MKNNEAHKQKENPFRQTCSQKYFIREEHFCLNVSVTGSIQWASEQRNGET